MTSKNTSTTAATAAMRILGFYDSVPATDKKAFTAGLVEILSTYPPAVVERAVSPSRGLPAFVSYPNLAKFKELLDEWSDIFWEEHAKNLARLPKPTASMERRQPRALAEPPQGHFANVHVPESHARYAGFCAWAKTAEAKYWKFGRSSAGVDGIWIPHNVWDDGPAAAKKSGDFAVMTLDQLRGHYAKPSEAAE